MSNNIEKNLLNDLECAESQLTEDIQTLGYLQDEYFISNNPKESFEYGYYEIQNKLMTLFKSMAYNRNYMRECIKEAKNSSEWSG